MIPDNSRKKLEQLRQEMALRAQLSQQYDKEMAARYTRDMPSFTEWMAQRQQKPMATGGEVEPSKDAMRLALTKRHGLYSPLEKAALEMPRTKGTGAEFMTELSKRPGFKAEEVADRRIPAPEGKMTKAEFLEHLKKHSLPKLEEKVYDESQIRDEEDIREEVSQELFGLSYDELGNNRDKSRVSDEVYRIMDKENGPQYGDYQVPGAKNYREMLLKLPETFGRKEFERLLTLQAEQRRGELSSEQLAQLAELKNKQNNEQKYQSSHWKEDPNVLAHMRLSDRIGPNGEKLLHLEELQSDWHQEGRKKGYGPKTEKTVEAYYMTKDGQRIPIGFGKTKEEAEANIDVGWKNLVDIKYDTFDKKIGEGVPEAPFKKSWHEMALKHALHHAAKHGYHGMLITPGAEQAKRYDLSKHLNEVRFDPATGNLVGEDHAGKMVLAREKVTQENLPDYIGKEGAQRILESPPNEYGVHTLSGAGLEVGGEGMKGFYDKIVPTYLNKLGKPHGAQVQMHAHRVKGDKYDYGDASESLGLANIPMAQLTPEQNQAIADKADKRLHYFPITEPMREKILKEGMPQYMSGGIIHKAEGGKVQPTIAQMRVALKNRSPIELQSVGVNEAPNMSPKLYMPPDKEETGFPAPGGVATSSGMPIGGIDMSKMQGGQQLMPQPLPQQAPPQPPQGAQAPQDGQPPQPTQGQVPAGGSNILQMTPQGQMMAALGGGQSPKPMGLAKGGNVSVEQMKRELSANKGLCMTHDHGYADGGSVFEEAEEPKKSVKAYKLFRTDRRHPGKLFPLFVDANSPVEMGKWLAAKEGEMKGDKVKSKIGPLAYRPGWHAGDLPVATHIGEKSDNKLTAPDRRPENHVWAEVEMPHDVDWQTEANRRGTNAQGKIVPVKAHITDQIPHGGHYRYKTNSNMTGNWLIGGAMKVNRVLPDSEVKKINKAAGTSDLPRSKKQKLSDYGFADGGKAYADGGGVTSLGGMIAEGNSAPSATNVANTFVPQPQKPAYNPYDPTTSTPLNQGVPNQIGMQLDGKPSASNLNFAQGVMGDKSSSAGMYGGSTPPKTYMTMTEMQSNPKYQQQIMYGIDPNTGGDYLASNYDPNGNYVGSETSVPTGAGGFYAEGGNVKKPTVEQMKQAIFQKAQEGLMRPSEVLGKHEGKFMHITEADRAKVEKRLHGMRGGVGFSQIGLENPDYAGRVWGVGKSGTAIKLLNRQKRGLSPEDQAIWTTFIGTPEMHTSNQLVFNRMWNKFQEARKKGLLSPEQEAQMLDLIRSAMTKGTEKNPSKPVFDPDVSFDNTHHLFDTFERRRILSDLMAGKKIGGKKAQIFDASKMIEDTTDPRLLHAPTLSVGPHVFSFSGETSHEPHLNKAFPFMLHGETSPDAFRQIPFKIAAPDYTEEIRQAKGREPGYMDIVRRIPRQQLTEKYLTSLQKQGYKKGGKIKLTPNQDTMRLELTRKK